jgi:signal transduction histidine kinase
MALTGQQTSPDTAFDFAKFLDAAGLTAPLPIGLVLLDGSLRAVHVNAVARGILGRRDDVLDRLNDGMLDDADHDWCEAARTAIQTGRRDHRESARFHGEDDQAYTLNVTLSPLATRSDKSAAVGSSITAQPDGADRPLLPALPVLLVIVEDVTRVTELERRLAQAENMASVGRLAARVAHELNNPLDGTLRYVNLCARVLADTNDEKVLEYLEQARQGLLRMTRIVSELLTFSRSGPVLEQSGNINWIVDEAIRSMNGPADQNGVAVVAGFHDDTKMPTLEGAKLFQVCCNLIKNAIDAMPDGGYLTVTTGLVGGDVVIRFEDTGKGLPDDSERVFEAFYTTKPVGQGTGLGLAICKDHIEQLHGRITAENGKEKGAVFTVWIPMASCGSR